MTCLIIKGSAYISNLKYFFLFAWSTFFPILKLRLCVCACVRALGNCFSVNGMFLRCENFFFVSDFMIEDELIPKRSAPPLAQLAFHTLQGRGTIPPQREESIWRPAYCVWGINSIYNLKGSCCDFSGIGLGGNCYLARWGREGGRYNGGAGGGEPGLNP